MEDELTFYAREAVADTIATAKRVYKRDFATPEISFKLTGRCAGRAHYSENRIRLNLQLFRENTDKFITRTIPHEVAHIIAYTLHGLQGVGHGYYWQKVMRELGVEDSSRCHAYDTSNTRRKSLVERALEELKKQAQ